jgi:hypothetical protein
MKHELLEDIWRTRDQIAAKCGYDVKRLAALVRREEAKLGKRLVRTLKPSAARRPIARGVSASRDS